MSSKRFILPTERLSASVQHEGEYQVSLTKEQIESFPPYDENAVEAQDKWRDYESRYNTAWASSPVQHREGTDRGQRWNSFEERMREDRANILKYSESYSPQSVRSASQQRKVA